VSLYADIYNIGFHKLNGHIPWSDISEHPSDHIAKRSQPDSDHKLEEPSHMKSDGVDSWLGHWIKIQKKKKRPLILKDPSHKSFDDDPKLTTPSKWKGKGKARYVESNESDDENIDEDEGIPDGEDNDADPSDANAANNDSASHDGGDPTTVRVLPPSPMNASDSRKSRHTFLDSLSDDGNYKKLLLLLRAAKASRKCSFVVCSDTLVGWRSSGCKSTLMGDLELS